MQCGKEISDSAKFCPNCGEIWGTAKESTGRHLNCRIYRRRQTPALGSGPAEKTKRNWRKTQATHSHTSV
ncbi:MAG: zinc ribbon domain-containing protein [Treponema sp.]|nr:zinc ribbon domain-containing protein [Treponema sp.]